jgi:DNA-binding response OmpR family regulator
MTSPKLLIVDDDRDFADSLAEALELFGHQVDVRFTGETGVEAARKDTFDVILVDFGLPGLSGVESLLKIKHANPDAHCFLLTGYGADQVSKQGLEAGAVEVLAKPIDPEELSQRLCNIKSGI